MKSTHCVVLNIFVHGTLYVVRITLDSQRKVKWISPLMVICTLHNSTFPNYIDDKKHLKCVIFTKSGSRLWFGMRKGEGVGKDNTVAAPRPSENHCCKKYCRCHDHVRPSTSPSPTH